MPSPDATDPRSAGSAMGVILVLGYSGSIMAITQTLAIPLLPVLPRILDTSFATVSWVATATLLTSTIASPVIGRLGDMYGKRRMMLVTMWALLIGCLVAALASNVLVLIVGRCLQGFGISMLPLAISVARDVLPPDRVNAGMAVVGATMGIGGGIGLPLSGLLLGWVDWHTVFWVNAVLAMLGIVLVRRVVPEVSERSRQPFDVLGAVWLALALVAILLPISKSATWGWAQPLPLGLYVFGLVALVGWARYELVPERPLVDVRLMRRRALIVINVCGVLMGFAMISNMYVSLTLLQTSDAVAHGFGLSVTAAGAAMAPGSLAMLIGAPISARLINERGPRAALIAGSLVMFSGFAARPLMLGSVVAIAAGMSLVNVGTGIVFGAFPAAVMNNVPHSETASANAMSSLTRAGGAALSSATVAAILSARTVDVDGTHVPTLGMFNLAFLLSGAICLVTAVVAWWLPVAPEPVIPRTSSAVHARRA